MALTGVDFSFPWEVGLMEWLQSSISGTWISIISFFSIFGEELFMVLILGFLYWCYDKKMGREVGYSVLMAVVWNPMLKNIFLRRRPYFDHEGIEILRVVEPKADPYDIAAQGYSFPSGHSSCAVGLFGAIARYGKRKLFVLFALLLPLLVGFSRVVVGAHYPTDVLVGWLIGILAIFVVPWLSRVIKNRWVFYGILVLTAVPGFFYCKSADFFTGFGLLIGLLAGDIVEERFVRFENTRKPLKIVLRMAGGLALFFGLNTLLKLPFSKEFLDGGTMAALLVRCARYALIAFIEFALYPMLFDRLGKRFPALAEKNAEKAENE